MPYTSLPIPEVYESISRPVAMDIVRQLFQVTGMPKETTINYFGYGEFNLPQPGSTALDQFKELKPVRLPSSSKWTVTVSEEYPDDTPVLQARLRPEHQVVFFDPALDVHIKPIYQTAEVTINITARFTDRVSALRWRDDLKVYASAGRAERLHEVIYHYPIPQEYLVCLTEIHKLREQQAGYGEDLGTWLRDKLSDRYTVITNAAGNHKTIAIREHQVGLVGWFEFGDNPPPPEREGDNGTYVMSFEYRARYEKCVACALKYPLLIHNQLVGKDFYDTKEPYVLGKKPEFKSMTRSLLDKHSDGYPRSYEAGLGIAIPKWDDWIPEYTPPSTDCLMRILFTVGETDPQAIIPLQGMPDHEFDPDALAYMLDYPQGIAKMGESVIQAHLFRRYKPLDQDQLTVDSDLVLRSKIDLDIRDYYHVWVGIAFDLEYLTPAAKERLRKHGAFARKLFELLLPNLEARGMMPPIMSDGSMRRKEFMDAIHEVVVARFFSNSSTEYRERTVGYFTVESSRSE